MKHIKKIGLASVLVVSGFWAFQATAIEKIKCTYKWENGEVVIVECCDSTQCH